MTSVAASVVSIDARTGAVRETVCRVSTDEGVRAACRAAADAAADLGRLGRAGRAQLLRALADGLAADAARIVSLADEETAIGSDRLAGELTRTCYQLRHFASVLDDGAYLEATIDHAG